MSLVTWRDWASTFPPPVGVGASVVFRPSGVASSQVATTWADLMILVGARVAIGAPFDVVFDFTLVGGSFAPPVGTHNFGGQCRFFGLDLNSIDTVIQCDTGVFIEGVTEMHFLTFTTIGTTSPLILPNNGVLDLYETLLGPNGFLPPTAPVIRYSLGVRTIDMFGGSAIDGLGSGIPVIQCDPGASGLIINGFDDALLGTDTFAGAATLTVAQRSLAATLSVTQSLWAGTINYTSFANALFATFGAASLPLAPGSYFLRVAGSSAVASAVRTDYIPPSNPTARIPVLTGVTLAQNAGGVVGPGYTIEVLDNATVLYTFTVPNASMPNVLRFPFPLSPGKQMTSNQIAVRVTVPVGMAASPTDIIVALHGF